MNGANAILDRLDKARQAGTDLDMKATLKGALLPGRRPCAAQPLLANLAPAAKTAKEPGGALADVLNKEFGSFERFKKEFTTAAASTEGSGWAALSLVRHDRQAPDHAD